MWSYLLSNLAWSGVGLLGGAVLTELGWDVRALIRNSGRRKDDRT